MEPPSDDGNSTSGDRDLPENELRSVDEWREIHRRQLGRYQEYSFRLVNLIDRLLDKAAIEVERLDVRVKSEESYTEALTRRRGTDEDARVANVPDVIGMRITTYYASDVARIDDLIKREFVIQDEWTRRSSYSTRHDQLASTSLNYVVTVAAAQAGSDDWQPFRNVRFELQLRTLLQVAWGYIAHDLEYKRQRPQDDRLSHRLTRLRSLIELADEQFSGLKMAASSLRRQYDAMVAGGDLEVPVDAVSLAAYLDHTDCVPSIVRRVQSAGWTIIANSRTDPASQRIARRTLLRTLQLAELKTIAEFDRLLRMELDEEPGFVERFPLYKVQAELLLAFLVVGRDSSVDDRLLEVFSPQFLQNVVDYRNGQSRSNRTPMSEPPEVEYLSRAYDRLMPRYEQLLVAARDQLRGDLRDEQERHRSTLCCFITARVKRKWSFLDKIDRKSIRNPFMDVRDLVGLRVVCPNRASMAHVEHVIRRIFDVMKRDDVIDEGDPAVFGYMSVHYIVRLPPSRHATSQHDNLSGLAFEIQVRTVLMDVWAVISHRLDYKGDGSMPPQLRRRFYALSGTLYVADDEVDQLHQQVDAPAEPPLN